MKKFNNLCLWLAVASSCFALDEFQQSVHCDDFGNYSFQDYESAEQRPIFQRIFTLNEDLGWVLPQPNSGKIGEKGVTSVKVDETHDGEQRAAASMPISATAGKKRTREKDNNQNSVKKQKIEDGFLMPVSKTPILDAAMACILLGQAVNRQLDQGYHFTMTSYEQFEACIDRIGSKKRKAKYKGSRRKALQRFFDFGPRGNNDNRLMVREDHQAAFSLRLNEIEEILRKGGQEFSPVLLPVSSTDSSFVNADHESFVEKCLDDAFGVADADILWEDSYKPTKKQNSTKSNQITPRKSPVRAALIRCILQGKGICRADGPDPFSFVISDYQSFDTDLRAVCDKANQTTNWYSRKKTLRKILRFVEHGQPNSYIVTVLDEMREIFGAEMASIANTPDEKGSSGVLSTSVIAEVPMAVGYEAGVGEFEKVHDGTDWTTISVNINSDEFGFY